MYKNKNIIFIGTLVPEKLSNIISNVSLAGNKFQHSFIKSVKPHKSISIPITNTIFDNRFNYNDGVTYLIVNQKKLTFLNFIYKSISDTLFICKALKNEKNYVVISYSFEFYNFLPIIFLKYIYNIPVYIIVADYFQFKKNFINYVLNFFLKRMNGIIVLSEKVNINKNKILINGIIENKYIQCVTSGNLRKSIIMSGSLGETTGLILALEFAVKNRDFTLHLTGRPFRMSEQVFASILSKYNSISNNIVFHGSLEYNKYLEVVEQCDLAFSFRNPYDIEHEYNFPSKILEYLSLSKIVISTKRYFGFDDSIITYSNYDVISLTSNVQNIFNKNEEEIVFIRKNIYTFLLKNFSEETLVNKINKFIQS